MPEHTEILKKLCPWTLACAVAAMNGSIYGAIGSRGAIDFDNWIRLVEKQEWTALTGETAERVAEALRHYAESNKHRHMNEILAEESRERSHA